MKHINKVKVRTPFPGFKEGDILELDNSTGLFSFSYNIYESESTNIADSLADYLNVHRPSLSKDDILDNLGFFEDLTVYKVKSMEEINRRINELKDYVSVYKNKNMLEDEDEKERDTALTVWQNMIWELEWVVGKRTI